MKRWILFAMAGFVAASFSVASAADSKPPAASDKKPAAKPRPQPPELKEITDEPNLPRVLLIGDSISMGYTLPVRELLKGKANVHRPGTNCSSTVSGLKNLDAWLGEKKWDVIHFNWGLHDLKYLDEKGNYVTSDKGKQVAPPEQYEKNLRAIVARLQKTGAKLIWCTTTPVPAGARGRVEGDEVKYNEVALKVMKENNIAVDDLHAVAAKNPSLQRKADVHFTDQGYKTLAQSVAASIEEAIKK